MRTEIGSEVSSGLCVEVGRKMYSLRVDSIVFLIQVEEAVYLSA